MPVHNKLYKWLKSKGRKAHKTLRQRPFDNLVKYKHLLDIEKYASLKFHANCGAIMNSIIIDS